MSWPRGQEPTHDHKGEDWQGGPPPDDRWVVEDCEGEWEGYVRGKKSNGYFGALYKKGCPACERYLAAHETFFPHHKASPRCESGGHDHCSCDTCF